MKKLIFDPTLEERAKVGYYFANGACSNCDEPGITGNTIDVLIPVGIKKPTEKFVCPNCRCKTLTII